MYTHLPPFIYTKNRFSTSGQIQFFSLWGLIGQLAVDQKVNRCWPKFQILKSDVSALCSYFYSSQNPFPGSGILNLPKKVPKITKCMWDPPLFSELRDIWGLKLSWVPEIVNFLLKTRFQRLRVVKGREVVRLKAEILMVKVLKNYRQ